MYEDSRGEAIRTLYRNGVIGRRACKTALKQRNKKKKSNGYRRRQKKTVILRHEHELDDLQAPARGQCRLDLLPLHVVGLGRAPQPDRVRAAKEHARTPERAREPASRAVVVLAPEARPRAAAASAPAADSAAAAVAAAAAARCLP